MGTRADKDNGQEKTNLKRLFSATLLATILPINSASYNQEFRRLLKPANPTPIVPTGSVNAGKAAQFVRPVDVVQYASTQER
jgi:hypothetical protein